MQTRDIRNIIKRIKRRTGSNNPYKICKELGIHVEYKDLGNVLGFFKCHRRQKIIYLNEKLCPIMAKQVCAHELGHVLLHPFVNTVYLDLCTYAVTEKIENEADMFVAELLISDEDVLEHKEKSVKAIASFLGVNIRIIDFKLQGLK